MANPDIKDEENISNFEKIKRLLQQLLVHSKDGMADNLCQQIVLLSSTYDDQITSIGTLVKTYDNLEGFITPIKNDFGYTIDNFFKQLNACLVEFKEHLVKIENSNQEDINQYLAPLLKQTKYELKEIFPNISDDEFNILIANAIKANTNEYIKDQIKSLLQPHHTLIAKPILKDTLENKVDDTKVIVVNPEKQRLEYIKKLKEKCEHYEKILSAEVLKNQTAKLNDITESTLDISDPTQKALKAILELKATLNPEDLSKVTHAQKLVNFQTALKNSQTSLNTSPKNSLFKFLKLAGYAVASFLTLGYVHSKNQGDYLKSPQQLFFKEVSDTLSKIDPALLNISEPIAPPKEEIKQAASSSMKHLTVLLKSEVKAVNPRPETKPEPADPETKPKPADPETKSNQSSSTTSVNFFASDDKTIKLQNLPGRAKEIVEIGIKLQKTSGRAKEIIDKLTSYIEVACTRKDREANCKAAIKMLFLMLTNTSKDQIEFKTIFNDFDPTNNDVKHPIKDGDLNTLCQNLKEINFTSPNLTEDEAIKYLKRLENTPLGYMIAPVVVLLDVKSPNPRPS